MRNILNIDKDLNQEEIKKAKKIKKDIAVADLAKEIIVIRKKIKIIKKKIEVKVMNSLKRLVKREEQ